MLWFWAWLIIGLLAALGAGFFYSARQISPGAIIYWLSAGIYALVFLIGWLWTVYNSLVRLRNRVRQGWSQVDVQLKRRHDLIPRLVSCVSGYKSHEAALQTAVAELRAQAADGQTHAMAATLIAIRERYPELKADKMFLKLQQELADTEQRIALARAYFNDIATFYNTRLEIFPDRLVAALAGLKPQCLWLAGDFERAPIKVSLED